MRNLYKRLKSNRWAPQQTLKESINNCRDKSLKQDAECVFSNPKSRKLYDHTHSALVGISQLRNGLGLTHQELWDNQLNTEFNDGKTSPLRLHELINGYANNQTTATPPQATENESNSGDSLTKVVITVLIVIGEYTLLSLAKTDLSKRQSSDTRYNQSVSTQNGIPKYPSNQNLTSPNPGITFNEPAIPAPAHGHILRHIENEALAPLEINTTFGEYYFIKMVEVTSGREELELFIHGGQSIEINMPLGTYTMKYATGKIWYGHEHLFGPETAYSQASSTFNFIEDYRGYSGYTVTLYKVTNGNLQTKKINASDF